MRATAASEETDAAIEPAAGGRIPRMGPVAVWLVPVLLLARRTFSGILRDPFLMLPYLGFPLAVGMINVAAFNRTITLAGFPPVRSFLDFILTGSIVVVVMITAFDVGYDVAADLEGGFFDRLLVSPMPRATILIGRLAGAAAFGGFQALVFFAVFIPLGATIKGGAPAVATIVVASMLLAPAIGGFTATLALRTRSTETVAGLFPIFVGLQYVSSSFFPLPVMRGWWFRALAGANPISWLVGDLRHLVIVGFDRGAALRAIALVLVMLAVSAVLAARSMGRALAEPRNVWRRRRRSRDVPFGAARRLARAAHEPAAAAPPATDESLVEPAPMSQVSFVRVSRRLAGRSLMLIPRVPSTFIPLVLIPIIFVVSFSHLFGAVTGLRGFPPGVSMMDWMLPAAILHGAVAAGLATGLGMIRDVRSGFFDRFLTAPVRPASLVVGPVMASVCRTVLPITSLLTVAMLSGLHVRGGAAGFAVLVVATAGMALVMSGWAVGMALRLGQAQVFAPVMQLSTFGLVNLSTGMVPLAVMSRTLRPIARVHPLTPVLALARQGFIGKVSWHHTWPGLAVLAVAVPFSMLFAVRSLRRSTR